MKSLVKRFLGIKKMQKFYEKNFRLSLYGMNYGNGGDYRESGELNALEIIKDIVSANPYIIFDVGGNVGNYSKALAECFGNNATIYSFEPSKKTFIKFIENTSHISNVIPFNIGFSDKENKSVLFTNQEFSGLASVYHRKLDHFDINMDISEEINLTTIDSFCAINNIDRIHLLKLDIEGHELYALNGALKMISNNKIDCIQFEFGGCNIDSRTYFQDFFYLLKDKFRIYRILKDGLYEISSYKETYEVFITINYLAIKK